MKTQLIIRWHREDGLYNEEVLEREDDGILIGLFTHFAEMMDRIKQTEKKDETT